MRRSPTLASIGSPLDVTVSELDVELFFPTDDGSAETLRMLGDPGAVAPTA